MEDTCIPRYSETNFLSDVVGVTDGGSLRRQTVVTDSYAVSCYVARKEKFTSDKHYTRSLLLSDYVVS